MGAEAHAIRRLAAATRRTAAKAADAWARPMSRQEDTPHLTALRRRSHLIRNARCFAVAALVAAGFIVGASLNFSPRAVAADQPSGMDPNKPAAPMDSKD